MGCDWIIHIMYYTSTAKLTESVERICWGGISNTRVRMSTWREVMHEVGKWTKDTNNSLQQDEGLTTGWWRTRWTTRWLAHTLLIFSRKGRTNMRPGPLHNKRNLSKFQKRKIFKNLHRIVAKESVVPRTTARSYSGIRFNKKKMLKKIMLLITLRTKKKEKGAVTRTMAKERRWRKVVTTFLRLDSSDHCKWH